ncbi:chitinase [Apiospora arundinis]
MIFNFTQVFGLWALLAPSALAYTKLYGKEWEDKCSHTTWEDNTSNESPRADDCLQLAKNWQDKHEGWFLTGARPDVYAELDKFNTCGFGVMPVLKEGIKAGNFWFGSNDLRDLVFDATMRFKNRGGRIGATGVAHCGDTEVRWGIYHTPI